MDEKAFDAIGKFAVVGILASLITGLALTGVVIWAIVALVLHFT